MYMENSLWILLQTDPSGGALLIFLISLFGFAGFLIIIANAVGDTEANEQIASDADAGQPPTPSLTSEEQTTSTSDGGAGLPPTPSLTSEEQTASDTETSGVETERSPNTTSGSDEEPDPHTVEITKEYDDD
jgi:hypothetical protein